ncbi:LysR family transcriptional regulator [Pseudooceanicola sp. HF7]|uniref:LysR family transcriptional regulator n=1 Tax=Pseudooceanicola sp. HF7 TaxID=2721560 RepID=UPI0014308851|nr:LysR family transcriptional regulator [Pseudooceanicola sp. HF7]NIZ09388.1 LysR family transcriptional regulator [Pseudooceanicola sp. HF7]
MELRQLRHFVTIVRFSSFSLAAEKLNLTQPALSKSIRTLEQSLGLKLLDRGPNGVRLTVFGESLMGYAELILSLTEEAADELDALRGVRSGTLEVGAMAAVLGSLLPRAVQSFMAARPDMEIIVHEGLNDAMLEALYAGKLDVVLTVPPVDHLHDEYEWTPLRKEPMDIVVGKSHPLADRDGVELADLTPFSWVVPPRPEPDRISLDALFLSAGLPKPAIAVETTSVTFLAGILLQSDHLSYLTRSNMYTTYTALNALTTLKMTAPTWDRTVCAVYRRRGTIRPAVLAFIQELQGIFS